MSPRSRAGGSGTAIEADVLILGGGVAGLACATVLGERAVVLEREKRPGGLVRTLSIGEYWFDHVLHLLYFPDDETERRVRALPGLDLHPCPPEAWVECRSGRARFPIQDNLRDLPGDVVVACLADLAEAAGVGGRATPSNYRELLLNAFGSTLCDEFFFPYNEKMWKRPLESLATSGFQWNIRRPEFRQALAGAFPGTVPMAAYNSRGWYPHPTDGGGRGMDCLSRALAARVSALRLEHEVCGIHLGERRVTARSAGGIVHFRFRQALVSTLPLPVTLGLIEDPPADYRDLARRLPANRVLSACLCIRGPRPVGTGHWRYYTDPALCFTRLIYTHAFDPENAPADGWGLMAEIPEPGEPPLRSQEEVLARVRNDLSRLGIPDRGSEIIAGQLIVNEHGYVVFEKGAQDLATEALDYLRTKDVEPLGRYGRWQYSSMGQVMRDGFAVGDQLLARSTSPGHA